MAQQDDDRPTRPAGRQRPGAPDEADQHTVLQRVASRTGRNAPLSLPAEESGHGVSPLINANAKDARGVPEGRGSYRVLGEIARGGMGAVLRGHDTDLGRDVAMKVLLEKHADNDAILQRFIEEAQIGGQLQHPGIVPVYELGLMADERPYFTMKLVKGRTLAKLLSEREDVTSDRTRFLSVFEKVCETLAYAHARNVVHRDLKPANIMVGAFGEVQVVDWGLAKVLGGGGVADEELAMQTQVSIIETVRSGSSTGASESMAGSVMGTPAYMPPEQAQGDIERLDERADVFALGALLCEILTGRPPYSGERDRILQQAARAKLDDARERLASCGADEQLIELTLRCLSPARSARPRSAEPLLEELRAWSAGQEDRMQRTRVEAAEARVRAIAERKARRLTLSLASVVVLAVLGGGAVWLDQQRAGERAAVALAQDVDVHLAAAALAQAEGDFDEALAACDRADAVLAAADDPRTLGERVGQVRERIQATLAAEQTLANERQQRLDLLQQLEELVLGEGLDINNADVQRERLDGFAALFADSGFDLFAEDTGPVVEQLQALEAPVAMGQALDEYSRVQRRFGWNAPEWRRLTALASAVDPDPVRLRLRDAIERSDRDELAALAASEEAREWAPATVVQFHLEMWQQGFVLDIEPLLRACQRRYPTDPALNQVLAGHLLFRPDSDPAGALRFLTAALAVRPDSAILWARNAYCLAELGRLDETVEAYCQGILRNPDADWLRGIGMDNLLRRLDEQHHLDVAQRLLETTYAAFPERPGNANNLAWYLIVRSDEEGGDTDRAVALLEGCVEVDPEDSAAWNSLGYAYLRHERWREALDAFQQSAELLGVVEYHDALGLGIALWHLGRRDLAGDWLDAADPLTPSPISDDHDTWMMRDFQAMADAIRAQLD